MAKAKTTPKKPATPKAPGKPPKAAPAPKAVYRISVANDGRQLVGEAATSDEAAKKAKAFQKKNPVPLEVARGKVVGSKFQVEFSEVVQPTAETAPPTPSPTAADVAEIPVEPANDATANTDAPPAPTKPKPAKAKAKPASDKPRRLSALDAAAQILRKAKEPMSTPDLIEAMAKQGLWSSPNGKTPSATLYSAILREINTKGKQARFAKTDRGRFAFSGE